MPTNEIYKPGWQLPGIACSSPAAPAAGGPVRLGYLTGVALCAEAEGGNAASQCTVDFGPGVWDLPVTDTVGGGIAIGDTLFLQDGAPAYVDNLSSGYFFGFALEVVGIGLTATIQVMHVPSPAAGALGAGTVGTTQLAVGALSADAAGRAKMAAGLFNVATVDDKVAAGAIGEDRLTAAEITGRAMAVVANANVIGGIPVIHQINITAGALGDTDVVLTHKTRVIDAWLVLRGAGVATTTLTVKNGATAITDAMAASGSDKALVRCATLDDAQWEIAAGGTLRVTSATGATQPEATVYVLGYRVA